MKFKKIDWLNEIISKARGGRSCSVGGQMGFNRILISFVLESVTMILMDAAAAQNVPQVSFFFFGLFQFWLTDSND